jgi:protein required for attachment to host cells
MPTTWIVAADSARARILEAERSEAPLREVRDMLNPEGRAKGREILTDAMGRYNRRGDRSFHNSVAPRQDPVEHEVERFSKELGHYLDKARNEHLYDRLYLVAPPKFLGLLRRNLSKEVEKLVIDSIDEDLSHLDGPRLESHLRRHLESGTRRL